MQDNAHEDNPRKPRIAFFDSLRGFTIISMVAFHAAYDAAYLYGFEIPWFTDPIIQTVWRSSISWVFLALAGWMTSDFTSATLARSEKTSRLSMKRCASS